MDKSISVLNELLVVLFNDILTIEQSALQNSKLNDISITEIHTIAAVGLYDPKTMSEVASELKITVGTLTTAINNLVKKGYVERKRSEEDRRVVLIQLTKKGKLVYRIHQKFHQDMIKNTIEGLAPDEEEVLIKSLAKLNVYLRKIYNMKSDKEV